MADVDLEEIKKRRLEQLRAEYGDGERPDAEAEKERQNNVNEMRNNILAQILDQSARARLNTLMIGKPEKGKMVENMLIQMAQTGRLVEQINENELIKILENLNHQMMSKTTKVKFDRRRAALDSDDEL